MSSSPYLMNTYQRLPVRFSHGQGVWLWDEQGQRYLDAVSGIAVCTLGHAHPAIRDALCRQAGQLLHTSNLYNVGQQERLAKKLTQAARMARVFFCNSGAEACETAIKLARLYAHRRNHKNALIVTMQGAFHGRTLGALAAALGPAESPFAPLPGGFIQIPFNDMNAAIEVYKQHPNIAAFMLEPIQGENGVRQADDQYLKDLRAFCDEHGLLLILDEVQTGVGRTGAWYACRHADLQPDVLSSAKGLGGGVPIGACLVNEKVAECIKPGMHGSTFGGNPLACSAALAVLETIEAERLCKRASELGDYLLARLRETLGSQTGLVDVRGRGLMIGIELDGDCRALAQTALDKKLLINVTSERVIRLLPPLILKRAEADIIVNTLTELLEQWSEACKQRRKL